MKIKTHLLTLLAMIVIAAGAAVVMWQIDPLDVNGLTTLPQTANEEPETPLALPGEPTDAPLFDPPSKSAAETAQSTTNPPQDIAPVMDVPPEPFDPPEAAQALFDDESGSDAAQLVERDVMYGRGNRAEPIVLVAGAESPFPPEADGTVRKEHLAELAQLIADGKEVQAHKKMSAWYWNHPDDRAAFQDTMEMLAKSIYFSPQPHYEDPYVIQPGDQLRAIAREYKVSWQYLARLNRVNPRKIRAGQKLKVVRGPFDAVVDLSDYELTVICHGQFVRRYRVGIGKDGSSPIGKFKVKDKLENPVYYGPDGVIAADDPQNPLGERWIDIGDSFGIHGTIEPDSIGKSESRGCIRMLNDDVAEVYDFLTVGSTVWIRR